MMKTKKTDCTKIVSKCNLRMNSNKVEKYVYFKTDDIDYGQTNIKKTIK